MGTTLTGTTPATTYDSLIKVTDNGPLSGTLKALSDGLGNDSTLSLSTTAASIAGTLAVTGNATFDTDTLFVDAANNRVGIGTAAPDATLTLKGTTPYIRIERTGVPTWQIQNNTLVTDAGFSINNITNATNPFFINGTTDNVGIGTSAPADKLHVSNGNIKSSNSGNTISTTLSNDGVYAAGTDLYLLAPASKFVAIYANNAEQMRITSAGNVGIGTSSPLLNLSVVGVSGAESASATPNGSISIGPTGSNNQILTLGFLNGVGNHTWLQSRNSNQALFYPLILNPSGGNVGIGTSAPDTKLQVAGTGATGLSIRANTSGDAFMRYYLDGVVASDAYVDRSTGNLNIRTNQNSSDIVFSTSAALIERLRITSAGNVGIGTDAPTEPLHVVGDARVTNLGVNFAAQADARIFVYDNSVNSGLVIQQDGASGIIAKFNGSGGATKVRIDADGLKFGADTAAANALDDYEEGTWTMGIAFGGASVGVTYASNTGTYTKIGRQVTVNGFLNLSSKGSSTGIALITGLPFTIANSATTYTPSSFRINEITFANQFQGFGDPNTTTIVLEEVTEAGVKSAITDADFANTSDIMVSLTYFV
jgi:hypothetical protein